MSRPPRTDKEKIKVRSIRMTESEWQRAEELAEQLGTSASNILRKAPFAVEKKELLGVIDATDDARD